MNIFLLIGLIIGFGGVILGYLGDEGVLSALLKPTSAAIVFGGTIGFVLMSFPLSFLKQVPAAIKLILFHKKKDYDAVINQLFDLANIARRDGILTMESEAEKVSDPFIKKGLIFVADGVESEYLKTVLEHEIEAITNEYEKGAKVFEGAGGVGPAMGVLGTVMGMVSVLREMGTDMEELGSKIATAFIATMYGVGSANLLFLPLSSHIRNCAEEEAAYYELIIEGLLCILEGEYPAKMRDMLRAKVGELQQSKESLRRPERSEKAEKPAKPGKPGKTKRVA